MTVSNIGKMLGITLGSVIGTVLLYIYTPIVFPFITTTLSFLFMVSVFEQYTRKRKPHQLMWTIAMLLFFLTAGAEAMALALGFWEPTVYRLYYVLAAIQVSFMGGGVIYLFADRQVINEKNSAKAMLIFGIIWAFFGAIFLGRDRIFSLILWPGVVMIIVSVTYLVLSFIDRIKFGTEGVLICKMCRSRDVEEGKCNKCGSSWIADEGRSSAPTRLFQKIMPGITFAHLFLSFSLFIFLLMNLYAWTTPLNLDMLKTGNEVSGLPWQLDPSEPRAVVRLFSPFLTVSGGIALIGGGFYSYIAWQLSIRKRTGHFSFRTGLFNVYIAVGGLVLAQGAFFSGFGFGTLYISESISTALMYLGFLESDTLSKEKILSAFRLDLKLKSIRKSIGD